MNRSPLVAALAGLLAMSAPATADQAPADQVPDLGTRIRASATSRCGTPEAFSTENGSGTASPRLRLSSERFQRVQGAPIVIPVAMHVVYSAAVRNIPDAEIQLQINVLNAAYAGTGFQFSLASTDRSLNGTWAQAGPNSAAEAQMKAILAVNTATTLNIYSNLNSFQLTGWASFPWMYPEGDAQDGVVIYTECFPLGSAAPYNEGDILVHEVGHWLGLYHTFQGGCIGNGDFVDDTPPQRNAQIGCPEGANSCAGDGPDAIHNYMDYTDDSCIFEFTAGQSVRMFEQMQQYRPTIVGSPTAVAGEPVADFHLGNGPNPFATRTQIFFQLPRAGRIGIQVHDLSGRRVADLGERFFPAGSHSIGWDGTDEHGAAVAGGVYFYSLHLDGIRMTDPRKMILVR